LTVPVKVAVLVAMLEAAPVEAAGGTDAALRACTKLTAAEVVDLPAPEEAPDPLVPEEAPDPVVPEEPVEPLAPEEAADPFDVVVVAAAELPAELALLAELLELAPVPDEPVAGQLSSRSVLSFCRAVASVALLVLSCCLAEASCDSDDRRLDAFDAFCVAVKPLWRVVSALCA
jgi:hypothetical protein